MMTDQAPPTQAPDAFEYWFGPIDPRRLARALHDAMPCAHDAFHTARHLDDANDIVAAYQRPTPVGIGIQSIRVSEWSEGELREGFGK